MAQTQEAPPAEAPPEEVTPPVEGEEVEETPEVIRVTAPSRPRPILLAGVAIPALLLSFLGSMFFSRAQAPAPGPAHPPHWEYEGALGPTHWGEDDPHAASCQIGDEQSPIDIHPSRLVQFDWLMPIQLKYKPDKDIQLVNNGHTWQVNYDQGSRMTFLGKEYELVQFHFHIPSEHTVNGKPAAMELHLVHATPDAVKKLAVLGLLIEEGAENPVLAKFWSQMPEKAGDPVKTKIEVNAADFVPRNTTYWNYDGSLTTPPCSQGVSWVLLKQPIQASKAQIDRFKSIFQLNARPVQPIKDRFIREELPPAPGSPAAAAPAPAAPAAGH
ncbi:MAG TPA: carbonic anhydrase family protein [Chloroflexota bacterium]|nr:carbonic anhydrase family protein [Chloroflexota bacterium]